MSEFEDITGLADGEELHHSRGAICPYCGYINEPDGESGEFYVEDMHTYECCHCEKEFKMQTIISYCYCTSKINEVEDDENM